VEGEGRERCFLTSRAEVRGAERGVQRHHLSPRRPYTHLSSAEPAPTMSTIITPKAYD